MEKPRLELNINTMDPDLILAVVCLQRLQGTGVYGDGRVVTAAQVRVLAPSYFSFNSYSLITTGIKNQDLRIGKTITSIIS